MFRDNLKLCWEGMKLPFVMIGTFLGVGGVFPERDICAWKHDGARQAARAIRALNPEGVDESKGEAHG